MAAVDALGLVGTTVEQVRFDACVDAGGFGLIYRGRHLGLDEDVAIKCLRIHAMQRTDDSIREAIAGRFRDETKILYRLSQGNLDIVRCISSGTLVAPRTHEITPYMVLEWLEGRTLSADLRQRREQGIGGRSLREVIELLDSAANAISYAHAHEVVHRDVKPGNLFITNTREGVRVKVLDFGLAKILDMDAIGIKPSVETQAGVHFCSPSYGAPEQFSPNVGPVGPWTDVYSFALVVLELLKGEKVRPASSLADGLVKALDPRTGSPSPSRLGLRLPREVDALLERAVSIKPLERPRDIGALWTALRDAAAAAPKADMAATVADADVEAAMERVRKAQAARAAAAVRDALPTPPPAPAPAPSPFAGTMLMQNAPSGAPHLPQRSPSDPPPGPAASTSPLASSIGPGAEPPPAVGPFPQPRPAAGTPPPRRPTPQPQAYVSPAPPPPLGRPPSVPPPAHPHVGLGTAPLAAPVPMRAPQAPHRPAPADRSALRTTDPRQQPQIVEPPAAVPKSGGLVWVLLVLAVLALGGGGGAWLWLRGRR
jgi:serine/threonine protein kinase